MECLLTLAAALLSCGGCGPESDDKSSAGAMASTQAGPVAEAPGGEAPVANSGTEGWEMHTNSDQGISFWYPAELGTAYIHPVDWPPQAAVRSGPFSCTEAGSITARAGKTERRELHGRTYCITREAEGAAGSIYTLYAYALSAHDKVVTFTFSLRAVQCGNYDDPERSDCERERERFDIDRVVERIAQTIRFVT